MIHETTRGLLMRYMTGITTYIIKSTLVPHYTCGPKVEDIMAQGWRFARLDCRFDAVYMLVLITIT